MSEMRTQLVETATALLSVGTATPEAFAEAGFGQLLVSEADGGFGGDWGDAVEVLRLVGFYQPRLDVAGLMVGDDRPTRPRIPELVEACPERLQGSRRGLPSLAVSRQAFDKLRARIKFEVSGLSSFARRD